MKKVLILGDVHLGKGVSIGKNSLGTSLNSRIIDQTNLLDWIVEKCDEKLISDVVITGDIFEDPKPETHLITSFISFLKKCQVLHTNVHVITGNHDTLRTGSFYVSPLDIISEAELENVFIYKDISSLFINNSSFTFVPFFDRKSLEASSQQEAVDILSLKINYELSSIPEYFKKILIGHLAIEGSMFIGDEVDDMVNEIFCPKSMFDGFNYVWMGHVHKPQVLSKSPYIAHIGSMDVSNFSEANDKHIVIYNCEDDNFEKIFLPTRALQKISVSIPETDEDPTKFVISSLKEQIKEKAIVRLDIETNKSVNKKEIEKFLLDNGVFNVSSISETKKQQKIKQTEQTKKINTDISVQNAIKLYADAKVKESIKDKYISKAVEIYNQFLSK